MVQTGPERVCRGTRQMSISVIRFCSTSIYVSGDFPHPAAYAHFEDLLATVDEKHRTQAIIFITWRHCPIFSSEIVKQVGSAGLTEDRAGHWRRVALKAVGSDLNRRVF